MNPPGRRSRASRSRNSVTEWIRRAMKETHNRRLSDRLLSAFELACHQDDLEVAELLHRALEIVMTRKTGPEGTERRSNADSVIDAYGRLKDLRLKRSA